MNVVSPVSSKNEDVGRKMTELKFLFVICEVKRSKLLLA